MLIKKNTGQKKSVHCVHIMRDTHSLFHRFHFFFFYIGFEELCDLLASVNVLEVAFSAHSDVLIVAANDLHFFFCTNAPGESSVFVAHHADCAEFDHVLCQWDEVQDLSKRLAPVSPVKRRHENTFSFVRLLFAKLYDVGKLYQIRIIVTNS